MDTNQTMSCSSLVRRLQPKQAKIDDKLSPIAAIAAYCDFRYPELSSLPTIHTSTCLSWLDYCKINIPFGYPLPSNSDWPGKYHAKDCFYPLVFWVQESILSCHQNNVVPTTRMLPWNWSPTIWLPQGAMKLRRLRACAPCTKLWEPGPRGWQTNFQIVLLTCPTFEVGREMSQKNQKIQNSKAMQACNARTSPLDVWKLIATPRKSCLSLSHLVAGGWWGMGGHNIRILCTSQKL